MNTRLMRISGSNITMSASYPLAIFPFLSCNAHYFGGGERHHAHGFFQRTFSHPVHIPYQAVGRSYASRKGLAVGHLGYSVLNEYFASFGTTAQYAFPFGYTWHRAWSR